MYSETRGFLWLYIGLKINKDCEKCVCVGGVSTSKQRIIEEAQNFILKSKTKVCNCLLSLLSS